MIHPFTSKLLIALAIVPFLFACNIRDKEKNSIETLKMQEERNATTVEFIDVEYDFGNIIDGETVESVFNFKNTGNAPLIISNATASCGCTVPEKPEAPVLPGEMGSIKVKFNSSGRPGKAHKEVTVVSNAQPAFPKLIIKGMVEKKSSE